MNNSDIADVEEECYPFDHNIWPSDH